MVSFRILAGGYDVFVATYLFTSSPPALTLLSRSPTGPNPSWISQHPTNPSILYAVNENPTGALQSFTINPADGSLSPTQDSVSSQGDSPAFATALSTGQVAVMNYGSGNARIVPTLPADPLSFDDQHASVISFPLKPGTNVSHPHMAVQHGNEVFVPDLGQDKIWRLAPTAADPSSFAILDSIPQPAGSGPRHIAIFEDRLYTLHELSSTLTVQRIPPPGTQPTIISSALITPPNPPPNSSFAAAEILIPPRTRAFPTPYIYVSNRNLGPVPDPRGGDAIAIFELVNKNTPHERLQLVKHVFTGLDQIRGMEFGPAGEGGRGGEEWLVAAGVAGSAGTVVLRRVEGGRDMKVVARNLDIPTRTSFVWI